MAQPRVVAGALALAWSLASGAQAATDADLAEIRDQIRQLKESYEARIQALEQRLKDAETRGVASAAPARDSVPASVVVTASAAEPTSAPPADVAAAPAAPPAAGIAAFNPAITAVLQGAYTNLSQDPKRYGIAGFVPSGDIAPPKRGFSIAESELGLSASIDDKFYGNLIFSLTPDNSVSVEEAYGVLTGLPEGLTPKFGRFKSSIGYLNDQHQHTWDFYDAPLPYQAFLGGQFTSDGLQLKWVAPTYLYVELGAEVGDGANFPGAAGSRNGVGDVAAYAHIGGDVGASHTWRAGLSYLGLRPRNRQYTQVDTSGNDAQLSFSGQSQLAIADFVWKYAPNGNAHDTNFKLQAEYFWRRENGDLGYDSNGALGRTQTASYTSRQNGWYAEGIYQFMPNWRVGARYDRLGIGSVDYGANSGVLTTPDFTPQRYAVMFDWTPSEFSRFRVQFQQARLRPDFTDNEIFLQYILTLGAHGAHKY